MTSDWSAQVCLCLVSLLYPIQPSFLFLPRWINITTNDRSGLEGDIELLYDVIHSSKFVWFSYHIILSATEEWQVNESTSVRVQ